MTPMLKPEKESRMPYCHPEKKHKAKGLCFNCYDKMTYHKDPRAQLEKHNKWADKNKDHLSQYKRERQIKKGNENPIKLIYENIRHSAKRRKIYFNLSEDDIKKAFTTICPVFNIPLQFNTKEKKDNSFSVDRIDNDKGYISGNIIIISWKANRLKYTSSLEDLEKMVTFLKYLKEQGYSV